MKLMHQSKVRALFKSIRLVFSLGTLFTLLITSANIHRNVAKAQQKLEPKKKDAHALVNKNTDDNSFLFVDCTGFFE